MGGSKQTTTQQQQSTSNSDIGSWLKPTYQQFQSLASNYYAPNGSLRQYQPYPVDQRFAPTTPQVQNWYDSTNALGGNNAMSGVASQAQNYLIPQSAVNFSDAKYNSPSLPSALNGFQSSISGSPISLGTGVTPGNWSITAQNVATPKDVTAQQLSTQNFIDPGVAAKYQDPYINNVLKTQGDLMNQTYQEQLAAEKQNQIANGAFGGDRGAVANSLLQRNYLQNRSAMEAQGLQNAYQNAEQQFNTDQARQLAAGQSNQGSALQAALANQQAGLQSNLANAELGLSAQEASKGLTMQDIASQRQLAAQNAALGVQQNLGMAGLSLQDLMNQRSTQLAQNEQQLQNAQFGAQYGLSKDVAYQNALNQNQSGNLSALGLAGNLYNQQGAYNLAANGQLGAMAQYAQQQAQNPLDFQYQQYLNSMNYGPMMLQGYGGALGMIPTPQTTTSNSSGTSTTQMQTSPWATALGLVGGLGSAFLSGGLK